MDNCIFCKIVKGEIPSYKVYEDEDFVAFLDIFPSHPAQTLVIPKKHESPKFSEASTETIRMLAEVGQRVAKKIENKIEGVERCQVVFEGFDVEHLHMKLYPAYNPSPLDFALTKGGQRASDEELSNIQKLLAD